MWTTCQVNGGEEMVVERAYVGPVHPHPQPDLAIGVPPAEDDARRAEIAADLIGSP
jgi:hypothetical protein